MAKKLVLLETMAFNTSDENVYTYRSSDGWKQYVNQGKPGEGDGSSSGNPADSLLELDSAGAITTKNGTKDIVPNNNMEGNIGTGSKKWAKVNAGEVVSAKVITNELIADKISGKIAAETVSKIEQNGTDLTVTYANGNKETFTVSGSVDLTDYLKSADADTKFALVNHNHDLSAYALKDDIKDLVNKTDADASYAPLNHDHNSDYYTKVEVNTNIAAAIAAAELNDKDVDLSAYLTITDADATYLKKTDAVTTAAVQAMIDGAGHLTNADIAGFLDKDTADTLYQPVGTYLDQATADTLYQPIGASSGGLDADTVQNMIDNAGHLTAADVATMQADIDAAKADASAAKTAAEQAAQDAQDAKTKAESVETIANDAKTKAESAEAKADAAKTTAETAQATADAAKTTADNAQATADNANTIANNAQAKADTNAADIANIQTNVTNIQADVQTAQSTADAAKTQAETNAATFADYVKTADLKGLVDQYIKDYLAASGSGNSGSSGDNSGGDTGGGTFSYGSLTPGVISTMNIPKNNNGYIQLTELGCKISEDQIINNKVHFYVMPGPTAVGDYVAKNYPEGLPIPMSFDGETEETLAYKKIFTDNHLEYPGWVNGFNNIAGDDDATYDEISFTGYTILAGWVFGIMMD